MVEEAAAVPVECAAPTALLAVVDHYLPEVLLDVIPNLPVLCRAYVWLILRLAGAIAACFLHSMEHTTYVCV